MRIRVFRRGERTNKPAHVIVSKSSGERLERTGRYVRIAHNALQEVTAERRVSPSRIGRMVPAPPSNYIPERLPPIEIPNTRFVEPQSDRWKLDHRSVSL